MATFLIDLTQTVGGKVCHMTFHYNNLATGAGNPAVPPALAANFESQFLPLINALQSDQVTNDFLYCRDMAGVSTAVTLPLTGTGLVNATAQTTLQPSYVANIKRTPGTWMDVDTGSAYFGV